MKKLLIASAATLALSVGSAFAADLAPEPYYKAPPPPPPPPISWTGCYIDGGIGYGMWDQSSYEETNPGLVQLSQTTNIAGEGWLGRLGGGCDYQFASRFVVGAFADYDFTDLRGTFQGPTLSGPESERGEWAAGGRIGYLVTPNLLTYFDAGYTQARFSSIMLSTTALPAVPVGLSVGANTYNGWFIGGGTEYALSGIVPIHGLFWRTEYRYSDYEAADLPVIVTATGAPVGFGYHMQKDVQTITSGIVWRFNFGGMGAPY